MIDGSPASRSCSAAGILASTTVSASTSITGRRRRPSSSSACGPVATSTCSTANEDPSTVRTVHPPPARTSMAEAVSPTTLAPCCAATASCAASIRRGSMKPPGPGSWSTVAVLGRAIRSSATATVAARRAGSTSAIITPTGWWKAISESASMAAYTSIDRPARTAHSRCLSSRRVMRPES